MVNLLLFVRGRERADLITMNYIKYMMALLFVIAGTLVVAATADAAQIGIGTEQKIVQNPLELERKAIELKRQQEIERQQRLVEERRRAKEKAKQQARQDAERLAEAKRVKAEKARKAEEANRQAAAKAKENQAKQQTTTNVVATPVSAKANGRVIAAESTAYTNDVADNVDYGGRVLTATGHDVTDSIVYNGMRIIAVDPSVIPLGTVVQIEGIGQAIALDTGGRIKGNIVDLLVDTKSEAINWGRRHITITIP